MIYRHLNESRFRLFPVRYRHSDAQVGVTGLTLSDEALHNRLTNCLADCYAELDLDIKENPIFASSLTPLSGSGLTPICKTMTTATRRFNLGPMAAVAGAIAERVVFEIANECDEAFCENGGDIAIKTQQITNILIFPGGPPFEKPIRLSLPPGTWGVASSSGEFGHSFSFGQAQMVTIVAESAPLADAAATAVANQVQPDCDPNKIVHQDYPGIQAIIIIWRDTLHYKGNFNLNFC